MTPLTAASMAATLSYALRQGLLDDLGETIVFYDLSRLESVLKELRLAFPESTLHALAVKANPLVEVLKCIRNSGHGCEVASLGELRLAFAAGFPAEKIVFDSPVKTHEELTFALARGVAVNANSLDELRRIATVHAQHGSRSRIGIRINPEVGQGLIDTTSVAVRHSKFGVSLSSCRAALIRAFSEYDWLTGLHVHIGSQGMSRAQLLEGISAVYDLFVELMPTRAPRSFNIGGGLPAKYRESDQPVQFLEYAEALRHRCPALFSSDVSLVTEFGRSVHAGCGWVASKVEYVIDHGDGLSTIFVHVGADMFVRKAYRPGDWHHDISVCDSKGQLRTGPSRPFAVAGPLCFAGDYLSRNVLLPGDVREGDYILIHDAGAYTFSMWSLYNSRQFPAILGYEAKRQQFRCLKRRQSLDEIVEFWSSR